MKEPARCRYFCHCWIVLLLLADNFAVLTKLLKACKITFVMLELGYEDSNMGPNISSRAVCLKSRFEEADLHFVENLYPSCSHYLEVHTFFCLKAGATVTVPSGLGSGINRLLT